ncbi:hypothetical protein IJ707_06755 [bacterium]|nr:hypothetical protein [bacterium]
MKTLRLKIYSLLAVLILAAGSVFAYQTLAFDFPNGAGNWHVAYHRKLTNETIIQYVPYGETYAQWSQTFIIHAYHNALARTPLTFLRRLTAQMEAMNDYSKYQYERITPSDAIATRCVVGNQRMAAQCDIYRVMQSFDGYITVQYINRDMEDFKRQYFKWLDAMRNAKPYQAEFRNDRYLSKDSFEL